MKETIRNGLNFKNYKEYIKTYLGANGKKKSVIIDNEIYMIKFPPAPTVNDTISYTNSCISEYISCKIFDFIGIESQKVFLGTYDDKIVVACKDFTEGKYGFSEFAGIKNATLSVDSRGYGTELGEILNTIDSQNYIDSNILKERFWDMFIMDAFLGNFDRHNGNWGLIHKNNESFLAPVYDCGSCLFPQNNDIQMQNSLNDKNKMDERLYKYPKSAIKLKDVKINYYNFLTTTDNQDCLKSLKKIQAKIDLEKINKIIDETPYISNIAKIFYKVICKERKEKILDKALEINKNIEKKNIKTPKKLKEKEENNR